MSVDAKLLSNFKVTSNNEVIVDKNLINKLNKIIKNENAVFLKKVIMQERRLMIWSLRKYIGQTAISAAIRCAQQKTRRGADKIKKEN